MPAFLLSLSSPRSTLQRNLFLDLSASVGLGTTMAVVAVLLPSLARIEGLGALGLATLTAIPFLASLLSLTAGRIGPTTPRGLAILRAVGSMALLLVFVAPGPIVIFAATFIFWISLTLGNPLQQRIWTGMYPSDRRGQLLGIVGTGRFAAGTIALLVCGLAIDGSVGMSVIAILAAVGTVGSLAITWLELGSNSTSARYSMRQTFRAIWQNPTLQRVTFAQIAFGAGLVTAPALIAVVQIDRLGLGMEDIAVAGLVNYLATALAYSLWGQVATRLGGLRTVALGGWLGVVSLVLYAVAPDLTVILVAAAAMGAGMAAINVSWPLILSEHAPEEDQAPAAAGFAAVMGLRGFVAPYMIMLPVQLGLIDITAGLIVCAAVTATGVVLYAMAAGVIQLPALPSRRRAMAGLMGAISRP